MDGRMGERLMAVVAQGKRRRVYLTPTLEMEEVARSAQPRWKPDTPSRGTWASNAQGRRYGFRTFGDYFTDRQLVTLTTFSDLVTEARERVCADSVAASMLNDGVPLRDGGTGATAYAEAVGVYLALGISRLANRLSTICIWNMAGEKQSSKFSLDKPFPCHGISRMPTCSRELLVVGLVPSSGFPRVCHRDIPRRWFRKWFSG